MQIGNKLRRSIEYTGSRFSPILWYIRLEMKNLGWSGLAIYALLGWVMYESTLPLWVLLLPVAVVISILTFGLVACCVIRLIFSKSK
jgi:hypothetical protein